MSLIIHRTLLSMKQLSVLRQPLYVGIRTCSSVIKTSENIQLVNSPVIQMSKVEESDTIDWSQEVEELKKNSIDPFKPAEDLHVPMFFPLAFNLAAYVNESPTLQKLVDLGVKIARFDAQPQIANFIVKLDFEKDVSPYIHFLRDNGLPASMLGDYLTKSPKILQQDLDSLHARIEYLKSKKFTKRMIARVISSNPNWLLFPVETIDGRLGLFQKKFDLTGDEVRSLVTRCPKFATYKHFSLEMSTFSIKEEFGFSDEEVKKLLLSKPGIWLLALPSLRGRFNFVHNTMLIPHDMIIKFPEVLKCRETRLKHRHLFLKSLKRDQYNPEQERYVSLHDLVALSDAEFCTKVAKSSIQIFNQFIKTL